MSYLYWTLYAASLAGTFYAGYHYGSYLAAKAQKALESAKVEIKKL
jgi:hypothetical protein